MMDESTIRETLRHYIVTDLVRDPSYPLTDDESIITGGLMDSFALAGLGVFVENEFDVYIRDPGLTVHKMNTLDQIVARVLKG